MSQNQLQLGGGDEHPVPAVTRNHVAGSVTSTTDCGCAGTLRVELVLVETPGRTDVELVKILEGNRATTVPMDALQPLLRALSKAFDCSERRKTRRAGR